MADSSSVWIEGSDVDWATEKTQQQVLKSLKDAYSLDKTQTKEISDTLKKIHKEGTADVGQAKKAIGELTTGLKKAGKESLDAAAGFDKLDGPLKDFGKSLKESSGAFKVTAVGVGLIATAAGKAFRAVQENVAVLGSLSESGVVFEKSFMDIQSTLADTGMSLEQFQQISENYTRVIGQNGIKGLRELVTATAGVTGNFSRFGLTTAEATEFAAEYLEQQRMLGVFRGAAEAQQNIRLKENIERLTAYSKVLNVSRKEMMESTKQMLDRTDLQSMFFTMAPEERRKAQEAFTTISQGFSSLGAPGQRILEMFTDMAASPIEENSESFRQLAAVAPEFAQELLQMSRNMKAGVQYSQEEIIAMAERAGADKDLIDSLRLAGGEIGQTTENVATLALAAEEARISLAEHERKAREAGKSMEEYMKTVDENVRRATGAEDALNRFKATAEYGMIKAFAELVGGPTGDAIDAMTKGLNDVTDKMRTFFDGPMSEGIQAAKDAVVAALKWFSEKIGAARLMMTDFIEGVMNVWDKFLALPDTIMNWVRGLLPGGDKPETMVMTNQGAVRGMQVTSGAPFAPPISIPVPAAAPAAAAASDGTTTQAPGGVNVVVDESAGREIGKAVVREMRKNGDTLGGS